MISRGSRGARAAHRTVLGIVVLAAFAAGSAGIDAGDEKMRVAVVDFDTEAIHGSWSFGWSWNNLARAAADDLASELVKTGKFRVIERQQLDKVLNEQNLAGAGVIDPSTAARLGKVLGVQLMVIGAVTEFGISEKGGRIPQIGKWKWGSGVGAKAFTGKTALTARLVDTTTAEVLGAYDGKGSHTFGEGEFAGGNLGTQWDSGTASKVLADAVRQLAGDIAGKSSGVAPSTPRGGLEAKVAKADGANIFLNIGSAMGVKPGDRFEIRRMGESIVDPDTGQSLGGDETVVGTVEITKVINEKLSSAKAMEGSGFKVGDRAVMR